MRFILKFLFGFVSSFCFLVGFFFVFLGGRVVQGVPMDSQLLLHHLLKRLSFLCGVAFALL